MPETQEQIDADIAAVRDLQSDEPKTGKPPAVILRPEDDEKEVSRQALKKRDSGALKVVRGLLSKLKQNPFDRPVTSNPAVLTKTEQNPLPAQTLIATETPVSPAREVSPEPPPLPIVQTENLTAPIQEIPRENGSQPLLRRLLPEEHTPPQETKAPVAQPVEIPLEASLHDLSEPEPIQQSSPEITQPEQTEPLVSTEAIDARSPEEKTLDETRQIYIQAREVARSLTKSVAKWVKPVSGEERSAKTSMEAARIAYTEARQNVLRVQLEKQQTELTLSGTATDEEKQRAGQELIAFGLQQYFAEENRLDPTTEDERKTRAKKLLEIYNDPKIKLLVGGALNTGAIASTATGLFPLTAALLGAKVALSTYGNQRLASGVGDLYAEHFGERKEMSDGDLQDVTKVSSKDLSDRIAEFKEVATRNPQKDVSGEIKRLEAERQRRLEHTYNLAHADTVDTLIQVLNVANEINVERDDKIIRHRNTLAKIWGASALAAGITTEGLNILKKVTEHGHHIASRMRAPLTRPTPDVLAPGEQLIEPFHEPDEYFANQLPDGIDGVPGKEIFSLRGIAQGLLLSPDPDHLLRPAEVGKIWAGFDPAEQADANKKVLVIMKELARHNRDKFVDFLKHPDLLRGIKLGNPIKLIVPKIYLQL